MILNELIQLKKKKLKKKQEAEKCLLEAAKQIQNKQKNSKKKSKKCIKVDAEGELNCIKVIFSKFNTGPAEKYDINQWLFIQGGKLDLRNGERAIKVSAHTKITPLRKKLPPDEVRLLNGNTVFTDFVEFATYPSSTLNQFFVYGRIIQITAENKFTRFTIKSQLDDAITVEDWSFEDDISKIEMGTRVIITHFKRADTHGAYKIINYGPLIMLPPDIEGGAFTCTYEGKNLSTIDYGKIQEECMEDPEHRIVTISSMYSSLESGIDITDFMVLLQNVRMQKITKYMKYVDKDGEQLLEIARTNKFIDKTGKARAPLETDTAQWCLSIRISGTGGSITVNAFERGGDSLFRPETAGTIFNEMRYQTCEFRQKCLEALFESMLIFKYDMLLTKRKNFWIVNSFVPHISQKDYQQNDDLFKDD